jgi:hypothetical protein
LKQHKAMGKVINMNGQEKEVVNVDEARTFFRGKNGEMKHRSFMQMIYRKALSAKVPTRKRCRGNYWFDKNYLLGINNESKRA